MIDPNKVADLDLRVVPKRLPTIVDVDGHLCVLEDYADEDDELAPVHADGMLYLNKEQWRARRR